MKFHYRVGDVLQPPPEAPTSRVTFKRGLVPLPAMPQPKVRRAGSRSKKAAKTAPAHRPRSLMLRSAIVSAVLAVGAGCATLDADTAKAWKIEPVLSVAHSMQSSQAYYTMGRYHDGSQAWDKAAEAYRKAIAVDAQNIEAYNALGVALARSGRLADAETTLRQATALDPSRAHVRSNLGYVLLLAGKSADAVVELRGALTQDATNQGAMANLRDALEQRNAGKSPAAPLSVEDQPAPTAQPQSATLAGLSISVPSPITSVEVPAPVSGLIAVAAPLQTAAVPAPVLTVAVMAPLTDSQAPALAEPLAVATTQVVRVVDKPTMGSLEDAPEAQNRPMVRQSIVRALEVTAPLPEEAAFRLEVSNGNGVTGMAARVSKWLGEQGLSKNARLTNQKRFEQETTIVQYRSGQEEAAQRVARSLPASAVAEAAPTAGLRGDVRVVLGRDWVKVGACLDVKTCRPADTAVAAVAEKPSIAVAGLK